MSETLPHFNALRLEEQATVERRFSAEDVRDWCDMANLEGQTPDQVPEPLIAGLFSYLLGEEDARIGETLTATVTITHLRGDKALVNLDTLCTGEDGRMICAGDALVLFQC